MASFPGGAASGIWLKPQSFPPPKGVLLRLLEDNHLILLELPKPPPLEKPPKNLSARSLGGNHLIRVELSNFGAAFLENRAILQFGSCRHRQSRLRQVMAEGLALAAAG
jgi:hypothetical protein